MKHVMRLIHGALLSSAILAVITGLALAGWMLLQAPTVIPLVLVGLALSYCFGWALDDE